MTASRLRLSKRSPPMRHFLDLLDLTSDEIQTLLDEAARLKTAHQHHQATPILLGRVLGLLQYAAIELQPT